MNKSFIFLAAIASLVIFVAALVLNGQPKSQTSINESKEIGWVGQKAPDFELEDFDGNKISLTGLKGKNVILFFSEGLMCYPACWDQMAKLGNDLRFNNETTVAYSVIVDQKTSWQQAINKMPELSKAKVLFDIYGGASKAYKTLDLDSSMHRGQIPGHTYFIIDKEGIVRYFFDDPQMGVRNDQIYEELIKFND